MALTIRQFDFKNDLDVISDFHKEHVKINFPDQRGVFLNFFHENLKLASEQEPEGMIVLEDGGKPIGFLWLFTFFNKYRESWIGQINYIHIDKKFRGKGYGDKLLKEAMKYFKNKGVKGVRASVMTANDASVKLFEKAGFKPKKMIMERAAK